MNNKPIGVFDSGLGGLTVLKQLIKVLPNETYMYLGDTARMPYGTKTPEEVKAHTVEALSYLERQGCKAVVIACNTATCHGFDAAVEKLNIPVIGIIEAGVASAISETQNGIFVNFATESTIASKKYFNLIKEKMPNAVVRGVACSDLVLYVERGQTKTQACKESIENYLKSVSDIDFDTLILGCTHFPVVSDAIKEIGNRMGMEFYIVDPALETARRTKCILEDTDLLADADSGSVILYTTGSEQTFGELGKQILGVEEVKVFHADI